MIEFIFIEYNDNWIFQNNNSLIIQSNNEQTPLIQKIEL